MWLTYYDHQINAVHDFHLFFCFIFGAQEDKSILAFSALLNWKVNFKLFNPEMGQNGSMCLQ